MVYVHRPAEKAYTLGLRPVAMSRSAFFTFQRRIWFSRRGELEGCAVSLRRTLAEERASFTRAQFHRKGLTSASRGAASQAGEDGAASTLTTPLAPASQHFLNPLNLRVAALYLSLYSTLMVCLFSILTERMSVAPKNSPST